MTNAASGNTLQQIDRLFSRGPSRASPTSSSWNASPPPATRPRSRPWSSGAGRSCCAFAGAYSRTSMPPRTPSRPPSWYWPARPLRSGPARRSEVGSTGWRTASPSKRAPQSCGGTSAEWTAMALAAVRREDLNPWDDWLPVLHEEIDRLPEPYRAAIVLCDLQEMTYEQAAHELRWTVPTLRCRLARRGATSARLIRRGGAGAGAALAALLRPQPASAATVVPGAWARAAVTAATGGTTLSTTAAALAAQVLKAMSWTRLKEAATLVVSLSAALTIGLIAMSSDRPGPERPPRNPPADPPKPAMAPAVGPAAERAAVSPDDEPGETVAVRGRVVDPAGKPVAGATIQIDHYLYQIVKPPGGGPSAQSRDDGRYMLVAPRDLLERFARGEAPCSPPPRGVGPGVRPRLGRGLGQYGRSQGCDRTACRGRPAHRGPHPRPGRPARRRCRDRHLRPPRPPAAT